jgi:hypothetical protein
MGHSRPVWVERFTHEPSARSPLPAVHEHAALLFVTDGKVVHEQRGRFEVHAGDMILVPAGEAHRALRTTRTTAWGVGLCAPCYAPSELVSLLDPFERARAGASPVVRLPTARHEHVDRLIKVEDIATTVGEVDAIVLTLPGTAATEKLIGTEVLAAVKPGTVLVNVGRGSVVDEDALLPALRDGRIGYAALAVFATEPLPESSPLWAEPNVLVSPHTGALNSAEDPLIAELFARNATRLLDGDELLNLVDTVDFY